MSEPVLTVWSVLSIMRRRRRIIGAACLVGAVLGVLLVLARPPLYTSGTLVLLPPQRGSDGQITTRDMVTEASIVTSDAVLAPARRRLHPVLSRERAAELVTADSPSQDMLHIVAQGSTASAAEALARAVTASEARYERRASSSLSNAERAALNDRQARLTAQLATVNREIRSTRGLLTKLPPESSQAHVAQSALAQLTVQQTNLSLDIDGIKGKRAAQQSAGATIVQGATPATRPRLAVWFSLSALVCMVVTAGVVAAVAVALARRDRRLRTRDEIADALGSPVLGSLKSVSVRSAAGWSLLLESYRPSPVDAWSLSQVLDALGARSVVTAARRPGTTIEDVGQLTLVVVLMADDAGALAVAAQLAAHTASLGVSTRLTARQRHAFADPLWATSAMHGRDHQLRPGLWVDPRRRKTSADLVVELAVVDRRQPALPDLRQTDAVVLIVSSGTATAEDLARVALTAYESGGRFRGAVVADPDSLDRTTGRLLQAQRAMEPPMPMKLVGVEADEWRERDGGRS